MDQSSSPFPLTAKDSINLQHYPDLKEASVLGKAQSAAVMRPLQSAVCSRLMVQGVIDHGKAALHEFIAGSKQLNIYVYAGT